MLDNNVIEIIRHTRKILNKLVNDYHNGGYWGSYYGDVTGYCGIASRFLINVAKRNGIRDMELVCGAFNNITHCWVEYNNFCIDITISQFPEFKNQPYRICEIDSEFYNSHYFIEVKGFAATKEQKKWGAGQNYEYCARILWDIDRSLKLKL